MKLNVGEILSDLDTSRGHIVVTASMTEEDGSTHTSEHSLAFDVQADDTRWKVEGPEATSARTIPLPSDWVRVVDGVPQAPSWPSTSSTSESKLREVAGEAFAKTSESANLPGADHLGAESTTQYALISAKFCVSQTITFTDSGIAGEDYLALPTMNLASMGMYAYLEKNGAPMWDGYLSSTWGNLGCTPTFGTSDGNFRIIIVPQGRVADNYILVDRDNGATTRALSGDYGAVSTSGTHSVTIGPTADPEYPVYHAAANALYRNNGDMNDILYYFHVLADSTYESSGDIYITSSNLQRKFVIVHELGHSIGRFGTGGKLSASADCSLNDSQCPASGSHRLTSKEYSACPISEGFAHFYAADTFNYDVQTDCWFRYWSTSVPDRNVDCELGTTAYPNRWMENNCANTTIAGRGAEIDWLKQFWDVHTNGSSPPSFNQILDWMDSATSWNATNGYSRLDAAANSFGGSLNSNWDATKGTNGVDH